MNGSKRLAICELRQSETQPVAKTMFLADHTFLFAMTSPETSHMKNVTNKLSFSLVTHTIHFGIQFSCYGILNSFSSSEHVNDRSDCIRPVRFLGHKMGEAC
jgi:hypothetical protein